MSSIFSTSPDCNLRTFVEFRDELRDVETGRLVAHHTTGQRRGYLARHPGVDPESLPPVDDPNRALPWDNCSTVNGWPADIRRKYEREAQLIAPLLRDPSPSRHPPTKPTKSASEMTTYRLAVHESCHGLVAYLAKKPIIRMSIVSDDNGARLGHVWHGGEGDKNSLAILLAGRIGEEELFGDVFESGCAYDDGEARKLALKLANDDLDAANTLLREEEIAARTIIRRYSSAIRKLAFRLALKREFILDLAEQEIREAIASTMKASVVLKAPISDNRKVTRFTDDSGPVVVRSATISNVNDRLISLRWTSGAIVRRRDAQGFYDEELAVEPKNVRLDRLNAGAPFLNSHESGKLSDIIGAVVPGSARMEGGFGFAQVKLSARADVAGLVQDIRDGIIKNVSVGYRYHSVERLDEGRDVPLVRVVDWEPLEISAVAIPADAAAGIG